MNVIRNVPGQTIAVVDRGMEDHSETQTIRQKHRLAKQIQAIGSHKEKLPTEINQKR